MGLFGNGKGGGTGAEKDLAHGDRETRVPGEATITAITPTGQTRGNGTGKEIEFSLLLEVAGTGYTPVVRQFMNDICLTGLAPGEPVNVLYDRTTRPP